MKLTIYFNLVLRLRMSGALSVLPVYAFILCRWTISPPCFLRISDCPIIWLRLFSALEVHCHGENDLFCIFYTSIHFSISFICSVLSIPFSVSATFLSLLYHFSSILSSFLSCSFYLLLHVEEVKVCTYVTK